MENIILSFERANKILTLLDIIRITQSISKTNQKILYDEINTLNKEIISYYKSFNKFYEDIVIDLDTQFQFNDIDKILNSIDKISPIIELYIKEIVKNNMGLKYCDKRTFQKWNDIIDYCKKKPNEENISNLQNIIHYVYKISEKVEIPNLKELQDLRNFFYDYHPTNNMYRLVGYSETFYDSDIKYDNHLSNLRRIVNFFMENDFCTSIFLLNNKKQMISDTNTFQKNDPNDLLRKLLCDKIYAWIIENPTAWEKDSSYIPPALKKTIKEENKFQCQLCGEYFNEDKLEIDHIFPHALGGSNNKLNLMALCRECNLDKTKSKKYYESNEGKNRILLNIEEFVKTLPMISDFGSWLKQVSKPTPNPKKQSNKISK